MVDSYLVFVKMRESNPALMLNLEQQFHYSIMSSLILELYMVSGIDQEVHDHL